MQPHLLSVPPTETKNTFIEENKSASSRHYSFLDYKETNGIFYTLSNENSVLSDNIEKSFNIRNLKQFAYVAGTHLSKYFSFLSVTIIPKDHVIQFRYHNGKWDEIYMPINIEQFIASYKTNPSGIALILWNIVSAVAKKTFASERHTNNSRYSNNSYIKKVPSYNKTNAIVELHKSYTAAQQSSDSRILYIDNSNLNRTLAEKKMHYRRGHWHYYWYGAHNSTERHKELKWVEETIVNREAINVVIIL